LTEIRNLRAVIASSSRLGTFHLDDPEAEKLARRMQVAKGIDPSLVLYAAMPIAIRIIAPESSK
jgi:hypothetical protein